jgi:hypothetical protein
MKKGLDVKRSVLMMWGVASSLFLWYFVVISQAEFSVFQYLIFCTILFVGGLAYDVLSRLAACPYTEENSPLWKRVRRILCVVFLGYLFIGGALLIGLNWGGGKGILFAMVGLVSGMFWALHFFVKLKAPILLLLSSK